MAAFVAISSRSVRVSLEAAKRHDLTHVATFLAAGGRLDLERADYHGAEFALRPHAWFCLSAFAQLLEYGAEVRKIDEVVEVSLPNGTQLALQPHAWFCLSALAQLLEYGAEVRKSDGVAEVSLPNGRIFELASDCLLPSALEMLCERFVRDEYGVLQAQGAVVVDVGANIGDSAVYFADMGAAHVYAFEPFSELYATAVRAVRRNLLEQVVTVVPRGVGARDGRGSGLYNPWRSFQARASLRHSAVQPLAGLAASRAEEFELVSLPSVLEMAGTHYPGRPLVLKMDCEGCEADVFEAEGLRDSLKAVKSILLEVHHYGQSQRAVQKDKLEKCGFSVVVTDERPEVSLLLATRKEVGTVL